MASGQVNRANRPNTWLHRPMLHASRKPLPTGAAHTVHFDFALLVAAKGKADEASSLSLLLSLTQGGHGVSKWISVARARPPWVPY